jgi:hypothetical protein
MATPPKSPPKSISVQQLSGAVQKAVLSIKAPPPKTAGPWAYINPGLICGIIWGPIVEFPEARGVAETITATASQHFGQTLEPVVQQAAAGVGAVAHLAPNHIICGFKLPPDLGVFF